MHSQIPWRITESRPQVYTIQDKYKRLIIVLFCESGHGQTQQNREDAEFVLKAVNCHDELVEACKEWIQWFDYLSAYQAENLVIGQNLESASENWKTMTCPSPDITKMKKILSKVKDE